MGPMSHHWLSVQLCCSSKYFFDYMGICISLIICFRYDKVLFAAVQELQSLSTWKPTVYHIALRELCGNLHYMISQYLYLHGHASGRAENVIHVLAAM